MRLYLFELKLNTNYLISVVFSSGQRDLGQLFLSGKEFRPICSAPADTHLESVGLSLCWIVTGREVSRYST